MHGSRLKKAENFRPAPPRTLQPLLLCLCCTSPAVLVPFFGQIKAAAYSRQKLVTKSSTRNAIPSMAFPTWEVSLKKDWCHPTWLDTCMEYKRHVESFGVNDVWMFLNVNNNAKELLLYPTFIRLWEGVKNLSWNLSVLRNLLWGVSEWSLSIYWVVSECSECSLSVLWVCLESALSVLLVFSECSLSVLWVVSEWSLSIFWVFSKYALCVLWVFSRCSLSVLWVFSNFLSVLWVCSEFSLSDLRICSECSLSVLWVFSEKCLSDLGVSSECSMLIWDKIQLVTPLLSVGS